MSLPQLRPGFDTVVLTPAFGVMFRDALDGQVVREGLQVRLRDPQRAGEAARPLAVNGHGAFACHRLRGVHPASGLPAEPMSPARPRRYALEVEDTWGRYLPMTVPADLPHAGLFEPACLVSSPATDAAATPHVPLYCAPDRRVPAGVGAVRVSLRLASDPARPAAWARLALRLAADDRLLAEGLADAQGCALLLCPLPAPVELPLSGSPAQLVPPLTAWPVRLSAFWSPELATVRLPDLCALQALPPVPLLQDPSASPPTPLAPAVLTAGAPLVIRGSGSSSYVYLAA